MNSIVVLIQVCVSLEWDGLVKRSAVFDEIEPELATPERSAVAACPTPLSTHIDTLITSHHLCVANHQHLYAVNFLSLWTSGQVANSIADSSRRV